VKAWRATALSSVLTFPSVAENILDREQFDLVHAQGFACHSADVITAHVCNCARYKRTPATGLLKRIFPALVIPRERKFFREAGANKIISISRVIQGELEKEYGVSSQVIYHGINTTEFARADKPKGEQWLFAGEAAKGLREAIMLLPRFPKARLLVVSRSELHSYRALADKLGASERVSFHGPAAAMPAIYQSADLFLYPSEYDAFGLVVGEAMACGLPVVIGKEIGAAEWISDGVNGFLCNPRDLDSVAAQLARIEKLSSEELQGVKTAARATALEQTWEDCAERTFEIYQRAIASKRANR
jgi:UDP-glucose:(heptosyl)LPS alpha-1,3-glucosyltransferase